MGPFPSPQPKESERNEGDKKVHCHFTSFRSILRKDINFSGWSSPSPPGRTIPGVASRTQTYRKKEKKKINIMKRREHKEKEHKLYFDSLRKKLPRMNIFIAFNYLPLQNRTLINDFSKFLSVIRAFPNSQYLRIKFKRESSQ